jgi:flavin reductase (DIM6/NTAB) family NADH-FMN oxidoreductase RutF
MKKSYPLSKVYGLLEPGPVVLVTTARKGRANVMTLSWLTMMDFEPPLIGMVMSDRNYSFAALKATKQCVINIPTVSWAGRWWPWATAPAGAPTSSRPSASRRGRPGWSRRR